MDTPRPACPARPAAAAPAPAWQRLLVLLGLIFAALPGDARAEARAGKDTARAHIDFRVIVPVVIRIASLVQPARFVVEDRHVDQGFVDLDEATAVTLTVNSRNGYTLAARYDTALLSRVELRVTSQRLTTDSGHGSMRITSGRVTDAVVPVSYRLHLAPGVRAGEYRWPVALSFSPATA